MENSKTDALKYSVHGRLFYGLLMVVLLYRLMEGAMLHNVARSGLFYVAFDKTYWLWILTGIPQLIMNNMVFSWAIDIILILLTVLCLYKPRQAWLCRTLWVLFLVFYLTFNLYANSHFKPGIAVLMAGFTFCFKRERNKQLWWEFVRYYFLFIYVSAALWKISKGGLSADGWFNTMLSDENVQLFYLHKFSFCSNVIWWFIHHPQLSDWLYRTGILLEFSFIIGFFTKKYDGWLLLCSIALHIFISISLGIHVYWLEFQVFYLTLYWKGFQQTELRLDRFFMPSIQENS